MLIVYGNNKKLKIDKSLGEAVCPNCGHHVELALAHESCYFHICYIPVFFYTGYRMKVCPNCGVSELLTKKQFKEIKKNK